MNDEITDLPSTFSSNKEKLLAETATIEWHELQRFFAQGAVLNVKEDLDLVEVAVLFAEDNADELEPLLKDLSISQPSNQLAKQWYADNTVLWSVVVAPYVLVQYRPNTKSSSLNKAEQ